VLKTKNLFIEQIELKKGHIMNKQYTPEMTTKLLAEIDELIQQNNADTVKHLKEEHRQQLEMHVQNLKKIKSEVQDRIEKKGTSDIGSGAEGIHEAIDDIVKAMNLMLGTHDGSNHKTQTK